MNRGFLSRFFQAIAAKRLSSVEVNPNASNQHEFNGVSDFKCILGNQRREFAAHFVYLAENEDRNCAAEGRLTWYDARENHPERTEFRMYFTSNVVMESAARDDFLVVCKKTEDEILVIIAEKGSTSENQVRWLFDIQQLARGTEFISIQPGDKQGLTLVADIILGQIGIESETVWHDENYLHLLQKKFGTAFPTTKEFSRFARETCERISPVDDPDDALMRWMEQEEMLFRTFEKHLVSSRLEEGFADDVDGFFSFSLSIQNRRKSRVGYAFENHLDQIFSDNTIQFSRNQITENISRPDFIFPGVNEYRNTTFPVALLSMLGVKTTCKDRWRQVLAEADRITNKHLATLEPGISDNQTNEMSSRGLTLVLPKMIHETFSDSQRRVLMTVRDFIDFIREKQTPRSQSG